MNLEIHFKFNKEAQTSTFFPFFIYFIPFHSSLLTFITVFCTLTFLIYPSCANSSRFQLCFHSLAASPTISLILTRSNSSLPLHVQHCCSYWIRPLLLLRAHRAHVWHTHTHTHAHKKMLIITSGTSFELFLSNKLVFGLEAHLHRWFSNNCWCCIWGQC